MEDKKLIEEARAEVENIQKDVQTQLATFEEADNEENKRLLADAREKLQKLIADTSQWLKENTDREIQLLTITKEKAIEVSKNEEFRATLHSGKEFIIGSGRLIASGVRAGADKLMENEKFASFVSKVNDKVEDIREDERVQEGAQRLRKGTMKLADRAYGGLKHFLNKDDEDK